MERTIIQFVTEYYYPMDSGFSLAAQNIGRAILDKHLVDRIFVFAPEGFSTPDKDRISVINFKIPPHLQEKFAICERSGERYVKKWIQNILGNIRLCIAHSDLQLILIEDTFLSFLIPQLRENIDIPVVTRVHGTNPEYIRYWKGQWEKKFGIYLEFPGIFSNYTGYSSFLLISES